MCGLARLDFATVLPDASWLDLRALPRSLCHLNVSVLLFSCSRFDLSTSSSDFASTGANLLIRSSVRVDSSIFTPVLSYLFRPEFSGVRVRRL